MSSLEPFTLRPRLGLCSAQLRLGAGWCISICSLDQIFQYHCFALIASSFCYYTSRPQFCVSNGSVLFLLLYFQTTVLCFKWQMMYSGMQAALGPTQELSWVQCTSGLGWSSMSTWYPVLSLKIFARAKSRISCMVDRTACWLERWTHDQKVASSNPGKSGERIFFSRVNFVCWLLLGVCATPVLPQ